MYDTARMQTDTWEKITHGLLVFNTCAICGNYMQMKVAMTVTDIARG